MGLDALLKGLESRTATPATSDVSSDVAPKPAPHMAATPATPETPANIVCGEKVAAPLAETESQDQRNTDKRYAWHYVTEQGNSGTYIGLEQDEAAVSAYFFERFGLLLSELKRLGGEGPFTGAHDER